MDVHLLCGILHLIAFFQWTVHHFLRLLSHSISGVTLNIAVFELLHKLLDGLSLLVAESRFKLVPTMLIVAILTAVLQRLSRVERRAACFCEQELVSSGCR